MSIQDAIELQRQITSKEARCAELLDELAHSLRIQEIWPDAFKHGPCKMGATLKPVPGRRFRQGKLIEAKGELLPGEVNQDGYVYMAHAYLKDGAGNKHPITAEQFTELKRR